MVEIKTCITGSKGKTSIVRLISDFHVYSKNLSIHVDSTGSYFNGKQQSNFEDSIKIFGLPPNVRPGRYTKWIKDNCIKTIPTKLFTTLECSFGCFSTGIGGRKHNIGIFTNLYNTDLRYNTSNPLVDMYNKKSFIFREIATNGYYFANLDNKFTKKSFLEDVLSVNNISKIGITQHLEENKIQKVLKKYKLKNIYFLKNTKIIDYLGQREILDTSSFPYYKFFKSPFIIENLLFLAAYVNEIDPVNVKHLGKFLSKYSFPDNYGRLQIFRKAKQYVIIDFAHDISSLTFLTNSLFEHFKKDITLIFRFLELWLQPNNQIDFSNFLNEQTFIKNLVLYNKNEHLGKSFYTKLGKIKTLSEVNDQVVKHLNTSKKIVNQGKEIDALEYALTLTDVVVHIHNNDPDFVARFLVNKDFEKII